MDKDKQEAEEKESRRRRRCQRMRPRSRIRRRSWRGRVENCLYILNYIANRTFDSGRKKHKTLYFATIDFKKAYDSVDRKELIKVLVKYGVNTK